uniref:Uromodulin-like n=1 Tax=Crassostrea virginica TaxID=6565 RepID=A0A8B8AT05_CRAVI|nr:uromodulin-like [Crassostrea virginica]
MVFNMATKVFIYIGWMLQTAASGSLYYCSVSDPCAEANVSSFFEPYARFENCQHNNNGFCDRYITPKWYRVNDVMLTQCPSLLSCGTLYPVWLNGTLPTTSDGVVDRKACKVGFESCCTRSYDIQIKHCGSFFAYCLAALDTCPERYCFGKNGTCEISTTTTTTTTQKPITSPEDCLNGQCETPTSTVEPSTTTTVKQATTSMITTCSNDPCIEHNVKCIDDQESRSPYCEYDKDDDDCDDELTPGWYKAKSPMVTHCPGLLGCGSIYPVWLNGTIPGTHEGVVTRQACQRGFHSCCSTSYDVKVKNCGKYTAYCLGKLSTCPSRYCFGTGVCQKDTGADDDTNENKDHSHGKLYTLLVVALVVLSLILAVIGVIAIKRFNKGRSRTSSFIDIQMAEKSTEKSTEKTPKKSAPDTRENPLYLPAERPPPYSPPSYRP